MLYIASLEITCVLREVEVRQLRSEAGGRDVEMVAGYVSSYSEDT